MRIYTPLSSERTIKPRPDVITEFDIQAELFVKLKNDGFYVEGDRRYHSGNQRVFPKMYNLICRFDIVVYRHNKAIAIIETKRPDIAKTQTLDTYQGVKYRQFGVPVVQFYDIADYQKLIEFLNGSIKVENIKNDEVLEEKKPTQRWLRFQTLFGRLRHARSAAFDARADASNPKEKHLTQVVENTLEEFLSDMEELDNLVLHKAGSQTYRRPEGSIGCIKF
jgi:hypothetical protein